MRTKRPKAFTLIELIIYIAILAIVLVSTIGFLWNVIGGSVRVNVSTELTYNAQLILNNITFAGRSATDVLTSSSTFGSNPGVLVFGHTSGDITFDTTTKSITVGGQSV